MLVINERDLRGADPEVVAQMLGAGPEELVIVIADPGPAAATRPHFVPSDSPDDHRHPIGWRSESPSNPHR